MSRPGETGRHQQTAGDRGFPVAVRRCGMKPDTVTVIEARLL
jgi:hypothetical protein